MNKIQELKKIEVGVLSLLEETNEILIKNYPLDSRNFLSEEEKKKVERNDSLVNILDLGYKNLYNTLTEEERMNLLNNFATKLKKWLWIDEYYLFGENIF